MKKTIRVLALSALAAMIMPGAILSFHTPLTPEVAGATGSGHVNVDFDTTLMTLSIMANWSGLSGTTTVAHIHCCVDPPGTVGVAVTPGTLPGFPVGVTADTYISPLFDLTDDATYTANFRNNFGGGTAAGAAAAVLAGMQSGRAYFNVHTSQFPSGEIRGFLHPVPEPATFAFAAAALTGLFVSRRYLSH